MRFNSLKRWIGGISQKIRSQTLRSLERDGLVTHEVRPTMPVTVIYGMTPLGRALLASLRSMIDWAENHMADVAVAH